jgi:hypothetical protein
MKSWLEYFKFNGTHRHEIPWKIPMEVEPKLRVPLIRSLQRFQVGESGEGKHLRKQVATTNDPIYEATIDLFIKEEQEHARLMAEILKRLNAPLLQSHWSDACFVLLRRLFGLNQELLVLLVPEIIAKRYFRALRDGVGNKVLKAVFAQILHDEEGHLAFHIDYLQRAFASLTLTQRILVRVLWRAVFRAACVVVILDHSAVLRAVRVSPQEFWWDCGLIFDEVAASIFSCAPTPMLAKATLGFIPINS